MREGCECGRVQVGGCDCRRGESARGILVWEGASAEECMCGRDASVGGV